MAQTFQNFKLLYDVGDFTEIRDIHQRPEHLSTYNRLFSIREGSATFTIDKQILHLKSGCTYLFPSGRLTSYDFSEEVSLDWIHFDARLHGNLNLFDFLDCPLSLPTPPSHLSRELYQHLFDLQKSGEVKDKYETPAILQILLAPFINCGKLNVRAESVLRLMPVFDYIEKNLSIAPRTAELAALLGLEQNYFINLFSVP